MQTPSARILPRGFGPARVRSTSAGVGSTESGDRPVRGFTTSGTSFKSEAANSSTTRGPRGLASEFHGRRYRTAKTRCRWVRGSFYVLSPEITSAARGDCADPEGRTYDCGVLGVTPDSDVTHEAKIMTNAGTSAAAGVVTGARRGKPGD